MNRTEEIIAILTDDFSFDENGIMKITREAVMQIVELLKEGLKAECKNAEHDAYGCLGYGKSSQNDELIEKCINCEKYTGNITRAKIN